MQQIWGVLFIDVKIAHVYIYLCHKISFSCLNMFQNNCKDIYLAGVIQNICFVLAECCLDTLQRIFCETLSVSVTTLPRLDLPFPNENSSLAKSAKI